MNEMSVIAKLAQASAAVSMSINEMCSAIADKQDTVAPWIVKLSDISQQIDGIRGEVIDMGYGTELDDGSP
jgi:hypothetical protein